MAAVSKGIGGTTNLPAQQAGADPLLAYCPDLDQWPRSWSYEAGDIPAGQQMVQCFRPFLHHLLSLHLSRKTSHQHRDNIWVLGGEVISRLQLDCGLRQRPIDQVVLDLVSDDGGPLLSHGQSEAVQRSFDATCRKLFRFLTVPERNNDRTQSPSVATNRPRH
jgi:hypothetical protein